MSNVETKNFPTKVLLNFTFAYIITYIIYLKTRSAQASEDNRLIDDIWNGREKRRTRYNSSLEDN